MTPDEKRDLLVIMSPMFVSEKFKNKDSITDELL